MIGFNHHQKEDRMPKYLVNARFTTEGAAGVVSEGGSGRRDVIAKLAADLGGKVECFYFAFGDEDVVTVFDMPDNVTVAAMIMTVRARGMVNPRTTVLLTPEEVDEAARKQMSYRPPGA
jgi:uncharacterized protein with GYD domain